MISMNYGRRRRGALLPTVLAVMVIIGLAASAALFMSRQERAESRNARLEATAAAAADEAQNIGLWELAPRAHLLEHGRSIQEPITLGKHVSASVRLTRLGDTGYALAVEARADDASGAYARRRTSTLLRLEPANLSFPSALTLLDEGNAPEGSADGTDREPDGWPCSGDHLDVPDVLHPLASADDSAAIHALRLRATRRLGPSASVPSPEPVVDGSECVTSAPGNWGDPRRQGPCGVWFPVIHAVGDLSVSGGTGQGILIVDGDLSVSGGFEFVGAVVVGGTMRVGPGGTLVTGGVRAGSVVDGSDADPVRSSIVRASCALRTVLLAAAPVLPVRDRPWSTER